MGIIQKELANYINNLPRKRYRVIIVVNERSSVRDLNLLDIHVLMDRIAVANLTGIEILELVKNNIIISIELDGKMEVL